MSLNWDATKVKDVDSIDPALKEAAIFATMGVGMNRITDENVDEFFARASFSEKVLGAMRQELTESGAKPLFFTKDEIRSLVGLSTNASCFTTAKFRTNVYDAHLRWNVR